MRWKTVSEGTYMDQVPYIHKHVKEIDLTKINFKDFTEPGSIRVGTALYDAFRSLLGKLIWILKTRSEFEFDVSILASRVHRLSISDLQYANDLSREILSTVDRALFLPAIVLQEGDKLELLAVCDASLAGRDDESSQGARAIGLTSSQSDLFAPCDVSSRKVRRRSSSSFDAEMLTLVDCADMLCVIRLLYEELAFGTRPSLMHRILMEVEGVAVDRPKVRCVIDCDARDCIERVYSIKDSITISKRRRIDVTDCQDLLVHLDIEEFRHVAGSTNPLDCGTKKYGRFGISMAKAPYQRFLQLLYQGIYIPDITCKQVSANVRRQTTVCRVTKLDNFEFQRKFLPNLKIPIFKL
jgi:hypothetical protein